MPIDISAAKAAREAKTGGKKPAAPGGIPSTRTGEDPGAIPEARTSAKLTEIAPNPLNPRKMIDPVSESMVELRQSLKQRGQLQAVAVVTADHFRSIFAGTPHAEAVGTAGFVIIGGGRRYAAALAEGIGRLKITVIHGHQAPKTPAEWLAATIEENVQRETLSVMETARSVKELRDYNTGREVAEILRKSPGWVSLYMSVSTLPASVQTVIDSAPFSLRQARSVVAGETEADQLRTAERIAAELLGRPVTGVHPAAPAAADVGATAAPTTITADDDQATSAPKAKPVTASAKTGRKAHTPAQKLASAMSKVDREVVIEALLLRFDREDWTAMVEALQKHNPPANADV